MTGRWAVGFWRVDSRKERRVIKQEEGEIKWRSQDEGNTVHALSKRGKRSVKEEKEKKESVVAPKNGVRRRNKGTMFCGDRIIL